MKIIQLPQGYLSYSQKELWKHNPEQYKKIYFDGRQELRSSNSAMTYGKVVADALERGIETGDLLTDSAMLLLPKYDVADKEIRCDMKTKDGIVPLLIKPDSLDSKSKAFLEYKTGKVPWTAKKAQNHPQMRYYAMGIYVAYKKLLKEAQLVWIETESQEEYITQQIDIAGTKSEHISSRVIIKPTGRVESFRVVFTLTDILAEMVETTKVAKEIETAWIAHVPDKRLEW